MRMILIANDAMKTIKLIIYLTILSIPVNAQNDNSGRFYYGFDDQIEIHRVNNKLLVKTKPSVAKAQYEKLAKARAGIAKTEWQGEHLCKIELSDHQKQDDIIGELLSDDDVVSVRPYYRTTDGLEFGLSDEVILRIKQDINPLEKEKILKQFDLYPTKITKIYECYSLSKDQDVIAIANELYESGLFEFAYPNIICKAELFEIPTEPNDPYFHFQVALQNKGQIFNDGHSGTPGADINALQAWGITQGSSSVIIAVVDAGVTCNHPDLPNTRQVRLNGSNFGTTSNPDRNNPSPVGNDDHGNACAGIIAATMNNNEGIAGIAPNCKIMPVRWDSILYWYGHDKMADAIIFAVDSGANIISNSWGYETANSNFIPAIVAAIQYAINKGVIVVFAAGNTARRSLGNNGYVVFPGNADVKWLLTVGASDRYDQQADYSPTDSLSLMDFVAPSNRAFPGSISGETFEMWTIDIPDSAGYNPWPSGGGHPPAEGEILPDSGTNHLAYTGRMGGTSFACAETAGVVALLLSVNPTLTPQQVFEILTTTTDKVGGYTYTNGRCNQMGWGRVDAYNAVQKAHCTVNFTNQIVSSDTTVVSCGDINVRNVTVNKPARLTLKAAGEVNIISCFEVQPGAELETIKIQ